MGRVHSTRQHGARARATTPWLATWSSERVRRAQLGPILRRPVIGSAPLMLARTPDDLDAGVPDPAAPQRECVRRLGGVPETRPAGLPTCPELRAYNEECRRETGYTGPDIDPVGACQQEQPVEEGGEQAPQEQPGQGEQATGEPEDDSGNTDPLDMSNRPLRQTDGDAIRQATGESGGGGPRMPVGLRFILHDTAALMTGARIQEIATRESRGPQGGGVTAFVPASGTAAMTRQRFFETRRPTTSEWEKLADVIAQGPREAALRQVWGATSDAERDAALIRATSGLGLTGQQETSERQGARGQLDASSGKVFTTAHWAVEEICTRYSTQGASVARGPGQENDLASGCSALATYFATRNLRLGTSTNVELVQKAGSNCLAPYSRLNDYTSTQYQQVVQLYLRAALEAGRLPEITTHFWVDRSFRGHCDPRCFDLGSLYGLLRAALNHPTGARYGALPNYGITWGTHNVWWHDRACGGSHP